MGRQNLGLFLPGETAYKDPGRFRDVLSAEAVKEAHYLSQMDAFYADLEERKRQFDLASSQKERLQERELSFKSGENEADRQLRRDLQGGEIEFRKGEGEEERELRKYQIDEESKINRRGQNVNWSIEKSKRHTQERGQDITREIGLGDQDVQRRRQNISHSEWSDEFDEVQRQFDVTSGRGGGMTGGGTLFPPEGPTYDPNKDTVEDARLPANFNDFGVIQSRLNPDTGLWEEYNTQSGMWVNSPGY